MEGQDFEGHRIVSKLGEGGLGAVFLARSPQLGEVALKVIRSELLETISDPKGIRERFLREGAAAHELVHPNIVRTFQYGVRPTDGTYYIISEFVPGGDLARLLERGGALPEAAALNIFEGLIKALHALEERRMIHRDVKPANLLFDAEGVPKLADFGLARSTEPDQSFLTRTGQVMGTPAYISPEQIDGVHDLDIRTDLYSAGVLLFRCLTGALPFESPSVVGLLKQHLTALPPDLRAFNPSLSPGTTELVAALLAKDRDRRPAGCAPVLARLAELSPGQGEAPLFANTIHHPFIPVPEQQQPNSATLIDATNAPAALGFAILEQQTAAGPRSLFIYSGRELQLGRNGLDQEPGSHVCLRHRPASRHRSLIGRLSRRHLKIMARDQAAGLVDLGSRSTLLNGLRLPPQRPVQLDIKNRVSLAHCLDLHVFVLPPTAADSGCSIFITRPGNGSEHAYALVPRAMALALGRQGELIPSPIPTGLTLLARDKALWLQHQNGDVIALTDGLRLNLHGADVLVRAPKPADQK